MRNNYYNDDRYDRRDRRSQSDERWNDSGRYRNDRDENRSTYFGGRDRMDMEEDNDRNDGRYSSRNSYPERSWSDAGRRNDDDRWNDNYRYSSSRNGNRYDDDDYSNRSADYGNRSTDYGRYGSSGRGWYGDSEGHSDASERGWENRRGDRGYSSQDRNRDDERRTRSGRGRGWFGESGRHSNASERGWDNRR